MTITQLIVGILMIMATTVVVMVVLIEEGTLRKMPAYARAVIIVSFLLGGGSALVLVAGLDLEIAVLPAAIVGLQLAWMLLVLGGLVLVSRRIAARESGVEVGEGDPPVVRLVNGILVDAIRKKAQTITIDCDGDQTQIIFEIEGDQQVVMKPPSKLHPHIISRIMLMAGLGYSEHGLVSEGHIHLIIGHDEEQFFNVYLRQGSGDQPAALIELMDAQGYPRG